MEQCCEVLAELRPRAWAFVVYGLRTVEYRRWHQGVRGSVMPVVEGELPDSDVDVVVVGSGFGGSVTAYRLAEQGQRVCVLERGKVYPPGSFPRTPTGIGNNLWDPSEGLHGMFDVWSFKGIDALVSSGLGGGSLIYANVLIRKDPSWFVQPHPYRRGVEEKWPVSYDDLDLHYKAAEEFMKVQCLPDTARFELPKTRALEAAAHKVGAEWHLAPLGVRFRGAGDAPLFSGPLEEAAYPDLHGGARRTCRLCGECDIGCNDGAKSTLDHTYLSAALAHGAVISTRSEVRALRRRPDGRFEIDFVVHDPDREGVKTDTAALKVHTVRASEVVLAAGTLGSTYLLLRNRARLGLTTAALGTRFCGNGDVLGFVFGAQGLGGHGLDGSLGPVISSYVRYPDRADTGNPDDIGMYIEDAGYPAFAEWVAESTQAAATAKRAMRFAWHRVRDRLSGHHHTNLSAEISSVLGSGKLSNRALPLLAMGRDVPDGTLFLDDPAKPFPGLDSTWTTTTSQAYFDRVVQRMGALADAMGGRLEINPTYLLRRVITVHPVGGCPMGDNSNDGVVNSWGEVYGVPGLYVADGSVLPGPVGPNPSLTIAALADRFADGMLAGHL
ncbi:MAG: FAD-dependent oxidoreductase [Acidimicrobiia bacterium]|nr:FAD-dependent oxidoreductase [Acidimicrobiia bacterium]